ncbi:MAG: type III-A CRISPR-associated protein Csm2 [Calditrichaeota bacterium]|nr:type III-A CRISPR-associated protein Csm2 [Calditrichota bacterium]
MNRHYNESGGGGQDNRRTDAERILRENTFKTFYDGGFLRKEIFMSSADRMARLFEDNRMSQGSFRSLFNMLHAVDKRIAANPDLELGAVREDLYRFVTLCEYQHKRRVIQVEFLKFVKNHVDVAEQSKEEFHGFVEYLKSIMARMRAKS